MNQTGPAAVLSYLAAGALVVLVMRMLGEMAVANPPSARSWSTAAGARRRGPGFTVGWLYWWFWAIVLAIEAVAGATILQRWLPGVPVWLDEPRPHDAAAHRRRTSSRSSSFGEFEFWFAVDQGRRDHRRSSRSPPACCSGIGGGDSPGLSNLTAHGGFVPAGGVTILSGIVIVIFAFVGAEIVTIAAAESDEPERAVAQRHQPGRRARARLLRRWRSSCRLRRAVERREARRLAVHRRARARSASRARPTS